MSICHSYAFRDSARFTDELWFYRVQPATAETESILTARLYTSSTGNTVYAIIFPNYDLLRMGTIAGRAGGGGYDKASAALWKAFNALPWQHPHIDALEPFNGRGLVCATDIICDFLSNYLSCNVMVHHANR